ncbi:Uncharacterized protein dnm_013270 [Desulfonema magnum]|uniref:Uncharacterized protein n=1 Tax=Desulfonema magnum TaxID=45655 RepID=A0A975BH46_9BACT|nr:Uncharacterized protein dnm_013270 [Desulfonema magnum]
MLSQFNGSEALIWEHTYKQSSPFAYFRKNPILCFQIPVCKFQEISIIRRS